MTSPMQGSDDYWDEVDRVWRATKNQPVRLMRPITPEDTLRAVEPVSDEWLPQRPGIPNPNLLVKGFWLLVFAAGVAWGICRDWSKR